MPGSAACSVKIQGIQHEYDTIEYIKEDIVEVLMNLKKLRVIVHSDEPVVLELSAKGEKVVTAGDIKKNAQVTIINKDLVIATLTDKKAELIMEITVKKGIGYEPVEERVIDKKDIGAMQIDSLFSPIKNVGLKIDNVRVGQRTDYERIILQITTDGSTSAEDAVNFGVRILQDQFTAIIQQPHEEKAAKKKVKAETIEKEEKTNEKEDKEKDENTLL